MESKINSVILLNETGYFKIYGFNLHAQDREITFNQLPFLSSVYDFQEFNDVWVQKEEEEVPKQCFTGVEKEDPACV